jgi:peptidoglycan/xylan/chitin deacetylase (PgdA/CDA1 family)
MHLMRGTSKMFLAYAAVGFIGCFSRLTFAQIEYEYITPREHAWFSAVNLTSVPNIPLREIGSGECDEKECDTVTTDRCFESCGNMPAPQDIYGCPRDHHWALTFDDGPSEYTLELLDYLAKEQIKATFCVMGAHIEQNSDILKRIYKEGHQIASHTYSHPHLMSLSNEDIVYEIAATEKLIEKVLGIRPNYIRPPFGEADERVKGIMRAMGYKVLLWNVDPTDYDVHMLRNVSKAIQGSFKMAISGTDTGLNLHEDPGFISLQHGRWLKDAYTSVDSCA